jgi:hypothetical protein
LIRDFVCGNGGGSKLVNEEEKQLEEVGERGMLDEGYPLLKGTRFVVERGTPAKVRLHDEARECEIMSDEPSHGKDGVVIRANAGVAVVVRM